MDLESDLYFIAAPDEEQDLIASVAGRATPASPNASIFEQRAPTALSLPDAFSILFDLVRIRRALRTRPIADVVARAAGAQGEIDSDATDASLVARRFAAARHAVPIARNCLPDSLALIARLARCNIPSTLVFGVKLDPFAAHCWVQSGHLLLTDRLEEVERFTPVRSIACAPAMR